jgi:hypothetical protein
VETDLCTRRPPLSADHDPRAIGRATSQRRHLTSVGWSPRDSNERGRIHRRRGESCASSLAPHADRLRRQGSRQKICGSKTRRLTVLRNCVSVTSAPRCGEIGEREDARWYRELPSWPKQLRAQRAQRNRAPGEGSGPSQQASPLVQSLRINSPADQQHWFPVSREDAFLHERVPQRRDFVPKRLD